MKTTIALIALLSITTSWAKKENKVDDLKGKREAALAYPAASHSYQAPSSNEGANSISVGAGYSVGGAKPVYSSYEGQGYSGSQALSSESHPASGQHATIQLAPITLQPSHGGLVGTDLNQLMSQLQQQLNSGGLTLQAPESYGGSYQSEGHSGYSGQEQAIPHYTLAVPAHQYNIAEQSQPSVPSYAAGTKGLGSYSSTGPVLFNPTDAKQANAAYNYAVPSAGHSLGSGGISLGSGAQYYSGASGSIGESLGGGYSLSSPYKSFENAYASSGKTAFKPSAYIGSSVQADPSHGISALSGSYGAPSFGGASSLSGNHGAYSLVSSQGLGSDHGGSSGLSGHSTGSNSLGGHSLGASSFGGHSLGSGGFGGHSLSLGGHSLSSGLGGHGVSIGSGGLSLSPAGHSSHGAISLGSGNIGASYGGSHGGFGSGSTKYISSGYLPAKASFGPLYSSGFSGPPSASYGIPNSAHSASSHNPQYYKTQPSYSSAAGSSSHRSPSSSLSSMKSYPKYSSGGYSSGSLSSLYSSAKDPLQGAYSENTYNTIKYSEELKASPQ